MRPIVRLVVVLACLIPAGIQAQQVRGVVRDSTAGAPLPGVVVTALDSAGSGVGRTITDADGRFTLALTPQAARLRLVRIGYHPRDLTPVPRTAELVQLAMGRIPPMLDAVRSTGKEVCPGSTERGAAFQLWEQARAGLLATVVARELKPVTATTLTYESVLSPRSERIHRQTKTIKMGQTTRPFVASASPSYFARFGYMNEDASGRVFNAPDADILIDESFASTHCFRLQAADASHAGQVGLAFAPAPGRDTLVDVQGVIWIDGKTPQLRSLDFTYTSLEPAATAMHAGGFIAFRTMENGVAFIERWNLRLASLSLVSSNATWLARRVAEAGRIRRTDRTDLQLAEISEAGGVVLDAAWADGSHWHDTPSMVTGVVVQKKTGAPVANGVVTLAGTPDTVRTSDTGEFQIATLPGKYLVEATDTTLVNFVAPRSQSAEVTIKRGAVTTTRLEVAPLSDALDELCHGQRLGLNTLIIVGVVALADRELPRNARVLATWQADYVQSPDGFKVIEGKQESEIDDRGRFAACGVARERPILLRLMDGKTALGDTTVKIFTTGVSSSVAWLIGPRRP